MPNVIDINRPGTGNLHKLLPSQGLALNRTQLDLTDVHYTVAGKQILSKVNLALHAKGITAIMGFNGAGKSILLKVMHGIVSPTRGSVHWNKEPTNAEHRLQQAMVFQKPVLLRRSVKANIDFVLKQRKSFAPATRNALLARVGLDEKYHVPARLLSGGEQQRLALARALACRPSILFLDEATASLDPASTAIIENIVHEQAVAGTKIIMVTHDAAQAARLADYIVFMDAGTITEHNPSHHFFAAPDSQAAKAYLDGRLFHHDS